MWSYLKINLMFTNSSGNLYNNQGKVSWAFMNYVRFDFFIM
jgi:hypothetical protein